MSYVPTEAKTAIVGAKVSEVEKAAWEEAVRRLGMESLSDLIRAAVRRHLDRPGPSAVRLAEQIQEEVEKRYVPLLEKLDEEIKATEESLARMEADLAQISDEIERLSAPPDVNDSYESISQKLSALAEKRTLKDAILAKKERTVAYLASLREKRERLLARRDKEVIRGLRARFPEIFVPIMDRLVEEVVEAAAGLRPFLSAFYAEERPATLLKWIWLFLAVQCRKRSYEAWRLVGCGDPLVASNYENVATFLEFWSRFCGPIGAAARGEADADTVSVAER